MTGLLAAALAPVHQHYLDQARQMQALSFAVHIPLVAFGISFPVMVLFAEARWLRTGDPLYRTLARRWTRIMVALFAVGVITGTILSFEMGLLWPNFTATFGGVFGLGFAIEGFSFFLEAIFIGIYVYGWDRLSPRAHFASGIPIVITGFTGSLTVISVNAWMNHPGGFTLRDGKVVDVHQWQALFANTYLWHELVHMYIAGYIVSGFLLAGAYAFGRLRGRWGRYERAALAIPLTAAALAAPVQVLVGDWAARDVAAQPAGQAGCDRRAGDDDPRALPSTCSAGTTTARSASASRSRMRSRCSPSTAGTPRSRASTPCRRPSVHRSTSCASRSRRWSGSERCSRCSASSSSRSASAADASPSRAGSTGRWSLAGPLSVVALIAGWVTTEVGRQPWVVYRVMPTADAVTGAGGIPVGYTVLAITYVARRGRRPVDAPPARRRAARPRGRERGELDVPLGAAARLRARQASCSTRSSPAPIWVPASGSSSPAGVATASRSASTRTTRWRPVWEANHVWLIFVLTVFWTAYPTAFGSIASTLAIPLFIAGVGIIFRGAAYALREAASTPRELGVIDTVFSLSSILTPFALGTDGRRDRDEDGFRSATRPASTSRAGSTPPRS